MVELKLEPLNLDVSRDTYVSVRVGDVQKLSRCSASRVYKFPTSAVGDRKYGKVEIFKRVGGCNVGILPSGDVDQEVNVKLDDSSNMQFRISLQGGDKVAPAPVQVAPPPPEVNPKVAVAKAYLDKHNLEMRLSEAMQALLKERPEDPAAFVAEMLAKSAGAVTYKAKDVTDPTVITLTPTCDCKSVPTPAPVQANIKASAQPQESGEENAKVMARDAISNALLGNGTSNAATTTWCDKPSVGTWVGHLRRPPTGAQAQETQKTQAPEAQKAQIASQPLQTTSTQEAPKTQVASPPSQIMPTQEAQKTQEANPPLLMIETRALYGPAFYRLGLAPNVIVR